MSQSRENLQTDRRTDDQGQGSNKYNTYHSTIKTRHVDVKPIIYIDSSKKTNNKDLKFKIGDIVRISKCKYISSKGYVPNWSEKVFVIKKVKKTLPWTYVISDKSKRI